MGVKVGEDKIKSVYLGDQKIGKINLGTPTFTASSSSFTGYTNTSMSNAKIAYGNGYFIIIAPDTYSQSSRKFARARSSNAASGSWSYSSLPVTQTWNDLCFGNGKFVGFPYNSAVGICSTDNGLNWTEISLPTSGQWHLCYGNGKFVGVCAKSALIAYSEDGVTWTAATLPTSATWSDIFFGGGKFILIQPNENLLQSSDGIKWTSLTLPLNKQWATGMYGNGRYVIVENGAGIGSSDPAAVAIYSDNLNDWYTVSLPKIQYVNFARSFYADGLFIAMRSFGSTGGQIVYSENGEKWYSFSAASGNGDGCYGNGKFVFICSTSGLGGARVLTKKDLNLLK